MAWSTGKQVSTQGEEGGLLSESRGKKGHQTKVQEHLGAAEMEFWPGVGSRRMFIECPQSSQEKSETRS